MSLIKLMPNYKLFRWENRELEQVDPSDFMIRWIDGKPEYYYIDGRKANLCQAIHFKRAAAIFLTRWRRAKGLVKKRKAKTVFGNTTILQDTGVSSCQTIDLGPEPVAPKPSPSKYIDL